MGMRTDQGVSTLADEGAELRQAGRMPFRTSARAIIYPPPGREGGTARTGHLLTQDLSETGVSIVYATQFPIGQRIDLEILDKPRSVIVCRITCLSDGHYLAGCRFVDDVPE